MPNDINAQITRITGNVAAAYSAALAKGATMPQTQDSDHLADTVATIPDGGGEEADLYASDTAPANPDDGSYWVDFSEDIPPEIDVEQLNVNGSGTFTAPSGKAYSPVVVPSGTQGTPTATKSISGTTATVTPQATDTTGYIAGTTKTGTAVTVTAAELDTLGTKSINANGTGIDVTGYSAVDVAVPGSEITAEPLSVTENGTYTAPTGKAYSPVAVAVPQGIPIDVSTSAGMTAVLTAANAGKAYRFTGTTDGDYINGDIYVVEVT